MFQLPRARPKSGMDKRREICFSRTSPGGLPRASRQTQRRVWCHADGRPSLADPTHAVTTRTLPRHAPTRAPIGRGLLWAWPTGGRLHDAWLSANRTAGAGWWTSAVD